jgi:hypothetical protein
VSLLFTTAYVPFSLALGLLLALLALEVIALLAGGSLFGGEDGAGLEIGVDGPASAFDLDLGEVPDMAAMLAAADAPADLPEAAAPGGIAGLLGLGATPFMVWLAALLLGFGVGGLVLQSVLTAVAGGPLGPVVAVPLALVAGLAFARGFARAFGRLLPGTETSATSVQFMGGLRGKVTQGTARRGMPAEVRLHDRHSNIHYLRCEPLGDNDEIAEGAEVLTVRLRARPDQWTLRILAIA